MRTENEEIGIIIPEAILRNPGNSTGYACRADVNTKLGHYTSAIEDLDRAIALAPEDASLSMSRASVLESSGSYDQAQLDRKRASELDPGVSAEAARL